MRYRTYDNYGRKHSKYYKGPGYYYKKTFIPINRFKRISCFSIYAGLLCLIITLFIIFNNIMNNSNMFIKEKIKFFNDYEITYRLSYELESNEFMYISSYQQVYENYYCAISTGTLDNYQTTTYNENLDSEFTKIVSNYFPDKSEELTNCINNIYEDCIKDQYSIKLYYSSLIYEDKSGKLFDELEKFKTLTGYELYIDSMFYNDFINDYENSYLYYISNRVFIAIIIIIIIRACVIWFKILAVKNAERYGDAFKFYEGETSYKEYMEKLKLDKEKKERKKEENKQRKRKDILDKYDIKNWFNV